jgi:rod shape determining protein RodA
MMFDRRLVQYFDWGLLGLVVLLSAFGLTSLYSAVTAGGTSPHHALYTKQFMWYGVGLVAMVFSFVFSYKTIEKWADVIYVGCNSLLLAVLIFGKLAGGSKRWLLLGPISVQPSEIAKVAVIIVLARYYSKYANDRGMTLKGLVTPVAFTLVPFLLIVNQPDLGTAMVIMLIAATMTIFVKIERRALMGIIASGVVSIPLVWFFLKGYQQQRILTFLDPDRDPLGAGYHIIQSKIAIGSGMIGGKGFLKGTQNALSFLPEQHTDFIFSVLAEEWGFMGSSVLLLLFLFLILWGLNIAHGCRDNFGTILSVGVTALIAWQVLINIGMVMGLMPVVGVPLPFISYGGSSIVTMMVCIGILLNVSMRRFLFEKG